MTDEPNANATSPAPTSESGQPSGGATASGGTTSGGTTPNDTTAPAGGGATTHDASAWPATKLEPADLTSFLSLRDSIHVFEWAALKLYMSAATVELRTSRAADVAELVKDFKDTLGGEGCPPGFTATSDGRCVSGG